MDIRIRDDFDVDLLQHTGSDAFICQAARVSTLGSSAIDSAEAYGLINFLMKNRHGSPFEHGIFSVRITQPLFSWGEHDRHRIGINNSRESGRYKEMEPVFYIPGPTRNLIQVGKPGAYHFEAGSHQEYELLHTELYDAYNTAWAGYEYMLENGIAKEVARMCLPQALYTSGITTFNPRSVMHYLSLRTKHEDSHFPSYPQWEINQVANAIEAIFAQLYPLTHQAFMANCRVAP